MAPNLSISLKKAIQPKTVPMLLEKKIRRKKLKCNENRKQFFRRLDKNFEKNFFLTFFLFCSEITNHAEGDFFSIASQPSQSEDMGVVFVCRHESIDVWWSKNDDALIPSSSSSSSLSSSSSSSPPLYRDIIMRTNAQSLKLELQLL